MAERTLTISSVGKSFSFTGWKIGWCSGPAELVAATRAVKQYLTFAGGTPLQHAAAAALCLPPRALEALRDDLRSKRDRLCAGLDRGRADGRWSPAGTYFVNADVGDRRGRVLRLAAGTLRRRRDPDGVFYDDKDAAPTLVRFAFCKRARGDRGGRSAAREPQLARMSSALLPLCKGASPRAIVARSWSVARRRIRETCICDTPICFAISL